VPDTWEEFTKAAEILTEPPNQYGFVMKLNKFDNGLTYVLYALVYNLGGSFWDEDLNPTLDTPEVIQALAFLIKIIHSGSP